jgi:hypothetical protein
MCITFGVTYVVFKQQEESCVCGSWCQFKSSYIITFTNNPSTDHILNQMKP